MSRKTGRRVGSRAAAGILGLAISLFQFGAGAAPPPEAPSWAVDLSPEILDALTLPLPAEPRDALSKILDAAPRYRFVAGPFRVQTDRRWFATSPDPLPEAPKLELRRWPGDTVLALYALAGDPFFDAPSEKIPGARLAPAASEEGSRRFEGTIETRAGTRPAVWIERKLPQTGGRLGALLLPGDAGLGEGAVAQLREELLAVLDRVEIVPEKWAPARFPGMLALPALGAPPGARDENRDPWQVVEGPGFTLGLPPGLRARRLDTGIEPSRKVPGETLWIRGRFLDRDGGAVQVGDGVRAGYVAEVAQPRTVWSGKESPPPAGAPGARKVDGEALDPTIEEWTGAASARVEHWREPGFPGDWLVFRLTFQERGVEIGLPVVEGWRSLALFWVPFTWRAEGKAPAPPPIDPAARFGIHFHSLSRSDRQRSPMVQGTLTAPGLRVELPLGWFPVASLRSDDGFPITVLNAQGHAVARFSRIASEPLPPGDGWTERPRPGAQSAKAIFASAEGARLFVAREGHAFLLEPVEGGNVEGDLWSRVADNVILTRPRP